MDVVNTQSQTTASISAMKKAIDVQEQGLMKLLDSAQSQTPVTPVVDSSALTGLGQNLDIKV